MDEPPLLYNPRLQPVELHAGGRVEILAPGETIRHAPTPQIARLLASGALQALPEPEAPEPPVDARAEENTPGEDVAATVADPTEPTATPAGAVPQDDAAQPRVRRGRSRPNR